VMKKILILLLAAVLAAGMRGKTVMTSVRVYEKGRLPDAVVKRESVAGSFEAERGE